MKKKFIGAIALALCVLLAAFCLTACGDSDSDDSNDTSDSALIGSWDSQEAPGTVYTFEDDGMGSLENDIVIRFSYEDDGSSVTVDYGSEGDPQVYEYTIKDNILSLKDVATGTTIDYKKK